MKPHSLIAATLALSLPAAAAHAAHQIQYRISGAGHTAVFRLDADPVPMISDEGSDFGITTTGLFDGVADEVGLTFYLNPFEVPTDVPAGGLTYLDNTSFFIFDLAGPQLFGGTVDAPKLFAFAPETLPDLDSGEMITISARDVPEPASWALMVAGFGLAGASLRRRTSLKIA